LIEDQKFIVTWMDPYTNLGKSPEDGKKHRKVEASGAGNSGRVGSSVFSGREGRFAL
jgi:hypothetical protein